MKQPYQASSTPTKEAPEAEETSTLRICISAPCPGNRPGGCWDEKVVTWNVIETPKWLLTTLDMMGHTP